MKPPASPFAAALREWRLRHGLRQKEAAAVLQINPRTYEGYERGHHAPPESRQSRETIMSQMALYSRNAAVPPLTVKDLDEHAKMMVQEFGNH